MFTGTQKTKLLLSLHLGLNIICAYSLLLLSRPTNLSLSQYLKDACIGERQMA